MKLKIATLNVGRAVGATEDEEALVLKWLKGLSAPGAAVPDVLCLQDFRVSHLAYLGPLRHFHFATMTNHRIWGKSELVGVCIASKYPLEEIEVVQTWSPTGDGTICDLKGVSTDNKRIKPDEDADRLVLETEARVAITALVMAPGREKYRIATHHGFWVRGGVPTPEQLKSTANLRDFLFDASFIGGLIAAADWNFDKDGKVLEMLLDSGAKDCLPVDILTTVAPHNPGAKFGAKPDRIFMWPAREDRHAYQVQDVMLDFSPGSDHGMLCATVVRA